LAVCEADEVFPNPAYQQESDRYGFLRPVTDGSTLYHAIARREALLKAPEQALSEAIERGQVHNPAGLFFINCRGRKGLLGEDSLDEELRPLENFLGTKTPVFGMYSDGETCPSRRGFNFHWNWCANAFVFGSDFNEDYAAAAKAAFLRRIDRATARAPIVDNVDPDASDLAEQRGLDESDKTSICELQSVLRELVNATATLTSTDCCHLRILSSDGRRLILAAGTGPVYEVAAIEVDLTGKSVQKDFVAYRAFIEREPIRLTGGQYQKHVDPEKHLGWREPSGGGTIADIIRTIEWWASFPIMSGKECVGVLSIDSKEPRFFQRKPDGGIADKHGLLPIVEDIVAAAGPTIQAALMRSALSNVLMGVSRAPDSRTLAQALVHTGARLLGRDAYLSLLLPAEGEGERLLKCVGVHGPENLSEESIFVRIDEGADPGEAGICGWVFRNKRAWAGDNAPREANGEGKMPRYKRCIPGDIVANYAVPLMDENEEVLGVLNAEASADVLDKVLHMPILRKLAAACIEVIRRHNREESLWENLGLVLPKPIHDILHDTRGRLQDIERPRAKIATVLQVGIRGHSMMAEGVREGMRGFTPEYYQLVANSVTRTDGTLDRFSEDRATAIYGAFDKVVNEEETDDGELVRQQIACAIEAGFSITEGFPELKSRWLARWRCNTPSIGIEPEFDVTLVIHTGRPLIGLFRSEDRETGAIGAVTFTAVGRDVSLARRLVESVEPNSVWVTASTMEYLKGSAEFECSVDRATTCNLEETTNAISVFPVTRRV
jgi:class 3 adenylate cyclase